MLTETTSAGTVDETARRRFEAAWCAGRPESIESVVPPADHPAHLATLEELVHIELEFLGQGWRAPATDTNSTAVLLASSPPPRVEDYLARFPLLNQPAIVRRLVQQECRVRRHQGDSPSPDEYRARFPELIVTGAEIEDTGPGGDPAPAALPEIPGHEVLSVLGRGGMGVVYKARQKALNRLVALKMILAAEQAEPEDLTRFRREAEDAARLQHPNIVQIYEVGEHAGRPYFSLEYVEGGSLADRLDGTPLSSPEAARLVETLARAMHYAHQRGVVHRDLKPANILLQGNQPQKGAKSTKEEPENVEPGGNGSGGPGPSPPFASFVPFCGQLTPKITDFGLAKRLDEETGQTRTGQVLGTPRYMAPEQALGKGKKVGPAADIYALGTILYELLTGRPPFQGATAWDVVSQVVSQEPVPPARLQPRVARDLDTICLKCLEKDPAHRYPSAEELANDLQRFLAGEAIRARPASLWERGLKWSRRRPAAAALVVVTALALLSLLAGAAWHTARLREERDEADRQRREAQTQRDKARQLFGLAQGAVDQMLTRVGDRLADQPQLEQFRRTLLEDALRFSRLLLKEKSSDPGMRRQTALAHWRVGFVQDLLGNFKEAEAAYRRALDLQQQLVAQWPTEAAYRHDLTRSLNSLSGLLNATDRPQEAEQTYRRALKLLRRLHEEEPARPIFRQDLAGIYRSLGNLLQDTHRARETEQAYHRALKRFEQLAADFPDQPAYRQNVAVTANNLGLFLKDMGRPREAERLFRRALDLQQQLVAQGPTQPGYRDALASTRNNLGLLLQATGRLGEAETVLTPALVLLQRLADDFPTLPGYREDLARSHHALGLLYQATGRLEDAEAAYRRALDLQRKLVKDFPTRPAYQRDLARTHFNLGLLLKIRGRLREAEQAYRRALDRQQRLAARFPTPAGYRRDLARTQYNLAELLWQTNRRAEAEKITRQGLALRTQLVADFPGRPDLRQELALSHNALGILLQNTRRPQEAEAAYRRALALQQKLAGDFPTNPAFQNNWAATLGNLATLLPERSELAESRRLLEQAIRIERTALQLNPTHPEYRSLLCNLHANLAMTLLHLGDHAAAARVVMELPRISPNGRQEFYRAADYLAHCVLAAERDVNLPEPKRAEQGQAYGAQAVQLLRQAVRQGYRYPELLNDTSRLKALRSRDDFKELLAELEKKARTEGK